MSWRTALLSPLCQAQVSVQGSVCAGVRDYFIQRELKLEEPFTIDLSGAWINGPMYMYISVLTQRVAK